MRQFIGFALSLGLVASAAGQTQGEVIIRRPGVPDRVIQLDSTKVRAGVAKVEGQLRQLTFDLKRQDPSLPARLQELQNTLQFDVQGMRTQTLALRDAEASVAGRLMPLLQSVAMRRPLLGIQVSVEPRETDKYGAYVILVTPGSPAEKAGILSGDVVVRIGGKSVALKDAASESSPGMHLIDMVSTLPVGKPVGVELRRGTQTVNVKVTPVEDDASTMIARVAPGIAGMPRFQSEPFTGDLSWHATPAMPEISLFSNGGGTFAYSFDAGGLFSNIELTALNEKLGAYFGATEGVLVVNVGGPSTVMGGRARMAVGRGGTVGRASATADGRGGRTVDSTFIVRRNAAGDTVTRRVDTVSFIARRAEPAIPLEPGDVVVSVDGRKVTNPSQLMRIVGTYEHNDEFKLQIVRQKKSETLTVKMP